MRPAQPCAVRALPPPAGRTAAALTAAAVLVWLGCGCALAAAESADGADGAWTAVDGLSEVQGLYPSSAEAGVVYVADRQGLWRSQDYGASFSPCAAAAAAAADGHAGGLPGPVTALAIDPLHPCRLYAGTDGHGLLISDDQGGHWRAGGLAADAHIDSLVFSPSDRSCATLYATHGLEHGGLSRSHDAGATWQEVDADYGIGGLVVLDDAWFCAARTAEQGEGFYRYDASKGWYCVLPEAPRVVLASPADPARLWFSSRDHGIATSDNAGISTHRVGPPDIDVEAMAATLTATGAETVYAFAPRQTGVIASSDGFATWHALTSGLAPSAWTQEGSHLAVSGDGAVLYATANGVLYRCDQRGAPAFQLPVGILPAVTVAGGGPLVVSARAPAGAVVVADCSALGGPAALALQDDGAEDGEHPGEHRFTARLDVLDAALAPGAKVVPVRAAAVDGGGARCGRAVVRVLPAAADAVLWDASRTGALAARCSGSWSCSAASPAQGGPRLLLHCAGAGSLLVPFMNPWESAIAVRNHALITIAMRATQPMAMAFRVRVHDNGQGSGAENAQASRWVDLASSVSTIDEHLQLVSIPLDDLLEGSPCSPNLIDLELAAPGEVHGDVELRPIRLVAQAGPRLLQLSITAQGEHGLLLQCSAAGRGMAPTQGSVRSGRQAVALARTASLSAGCAIPASWYDPALPGEAAMADTVSWSGLIDARGLPAGAAHLELVLGDSHGLTITTVPVTIGAAAAAAAAAHALIPGLDSADAESRHAALVAAPVLTLGSPAQGLGVQLVWEPGHLDLRLQVHDPGVAACQVPADLVPATLGDQPQAELLVQAAAATSPPHHLQVVWTTAGPRAWCDAVAVPCTGQRSADGYDVELQAPIRLAPADAGADPTAATLVHRYAQLTTTDHHLLGFHHGAAAAGDDLAELAPAGGSGAWRAVTQSLHEVTCSAAGALADSAVALAAWSVNGRAPEAVVLASDRRHVALFASAWPAGELTITGPAPAAPATAAALPADGAFGAACR